MVELKADKINIFSWTDPRPNWSVSICQYSSEFVYLRSKFARISSDVPSQLEPPLISPVQSDRVPSRLLHKPYVLLL